MTVLDCVLVGFNDTSFPEYVDLVRAMGETSGAYRDLALALVDVDGVPQRSMDLLNRYHFEGRPAERPFHNSDFLWPVITYLGTYLARRGFTFDYVNLFHQEKERLRELLESGDVLSVAITTTLYVSPHPLIEVIRFVRDVNPDVKIVVGGPYVLNRTKMLDTKALGELFSYLGADVYVISSEGEAALVQVLEALKSGRRLDGIANIAYREDGGFVSTPIDPESNDLAENMVDYSLFPADEVRGFATIRTARSCPFKCSFCGFPARAGAYVYLPVDLVAKELDALAEAGVHTLTIIDDTFNVPKGRFKSILRLMIERGYGFRWNSYLRSDHVDDETIELMHESGCEGVFLGMESGSDVVLEAMNKTARRRHYAYVIPRLKDAGIVTHGSFIVGFPRESAETYAETNQFIEEVQPDFFRAQLWYCDLTTPVWAERERWGLTGAAFKWSHDTMDAATATDLVDRMFLDVENSIWLPQAGFELWSVYYLQRRGMSLAQIKTFLRAFNAAIQERMLLGTPSVAPDLLETLRRCSQFDRGQPPSLDAIERVERYRAVAA